jgi:hypothetical protein
MPLDLCTRCLHAAVHACMHVRGLLERPRPRAAGATQPRHAATAANTRADPPCRSYFWRPRCSRAAAAGEAAPARWAPRSRHAAITANTRADPPPLLPLVLLAAALLALAVGGASAMPASLAEHAADVPIPRLQMATDDVATRQGTLAPTARTS